MPYQLRQSSCRTPPQRSHASPTSADRPSAHRTTLLVRTAVRVTDNLKRLEEGLTLLLI